MDVHESTKTTLFADKKFERQFSSNAAHYVYNRLLSAFFKKGTKAVRTF